MKYRHELRDGVHGFVGFDNLEKRLIDSWPFQRLRNIHQLAMCYQVYPGATHRRFEHSLGVMDTAERIFNSLFSHSDKLSEAVKERIGDELQPYKLDYWRRTVRLAGLLHDVGHLPFSHAAEDLLPAGWNHERLTGEIILNSEIARILADETAAPKIGDVVALALDAKKQTGTPLSPWKTLLNEIVTGNTFGADRIDYLLRDSLHSGVAYGKFDPVRLIEGLRIVIDNETDEIAIGLEANAIHAAEALLLARYFMYTQVYFHPVRRAYDEHLKDFLKNWLSGGKFSTDWQAVLKVTDNQVLDAMQTAYMDSGNPLCALSQRLLGRKHFRTVYELVATHKERSPTIFDDLLTVARETASTENIRFQKYGPKSEDNAFPVITKSGIVETSVNVSSVIRNVPPLEIGLIFSEKSWKDKVKVALDNNLRAVMGNS